MIDTLPQGFSLIQEGSNKIVGCEPSTDGIVAYVKRNEGHDSRYERFGQRYCTLMKATHDLATVLFPGEFVHWIGATSLTDNPLFSARIQMQKIELSEGQADSRRPTTPEGHKHNDLFKKARADGNIGQTIMKWREAGFTIEDISAHNINFGVNGEIQYVDEIRPYEYQEGEMQWKVDEIKCRQYIVSHLDNSQQEAALLALDKWIQAKQTFKKTKHK